MATTLQTRRFTITRVNDTGFQALEEPGTWFNLSKYAKPPLAIPPVGSRVEAQVDPRVAGEAANGPRPPRQVPHFFDQRGVFRIVRIIRIIEKHADGVDARKRAFQPLRFVADHPRHLLRKILEQDLGDRQHVHVSTASDTADTI